MNKKNEPAIIWKLVTCQRITSKILHLDGSPPEPAIRSGDAGQRIPCFDSSQLITTLMYNQWAPKLATKCESKHWHACGADGRSLGRSVGRYTVTWLPSFFGRVDYFIFLPMVLCWRASRARAPLLLKTESLDNAILELWLAWRSWYMSRSRLHGASISHISPWSQPFPTKNQINLFSYFTLLVNSLVQCFGAFY